MKAEPGLTQADAKRAFEYLQTLKALWCDPRTNKKATLGMLIASAAGSVMAEGKTDSAAIAADMLRCASAKTGKSLEALSRYAEGIFILNRGFAPTLTRVGDESPQNSGAT